MTVTSTSPAADHNTPDWLKSLMSALPFNTLVGLLVCLLLIIILLLICLFCRKRALKCLSASCACCCGAFIHLFSCCMVQFTSAIIWMAESIRQKCAGRAAGDNQSQNEPGSEVIPKENLFLNCFTRFFLALGFDYLYLFLSIYSVIPVFLCLSSQFFCSNCSSFLSWKPFFEEFYHSETQKRQRSGQEWTCYRGQPD